MFSLFKAIKALLSGHPAEEPQAQPSQQEVDLRAQRETLFQKLYGYEYDVIDLTHLNDEALKKQYFTELEEGKAQGWMPVFVDLERLTPALEEAGDNIEAAREAWLRKSELTIDDVFAGKSETLSALNEATLHLESIQSKEIALERDLSLIGNHVILAKVPTDKPYTLFIHFFACDMEFLAPNAVISIAKRWYEQFGAIPCILSASVQTFYVPHPPSDPDTLKELAAEQFCYCPDIVYQGTDTVNALAEELAKNHEWYFWWD